MNVTTAGFAYLLLVLVTASTWLPWRQPSPQFWRPWLLIISLSRSSLDPSKSEDWIALLSFAATSVIASHLSNTVKPRTSEMIRAEEALRQAQSDLAHVSRITTMGELTASLAHEVNQPIAATRTAKERNPCG